MSNPFELRLQLFQEAKDYLVSVYEREVLEWDRKQQEKCDIENKWSNDYSRYSDLKEEGKASASDCPISPDPIKLPEYPKYPTREDILEMAKFIRSFISDKGGEEGDNIVAATAQALT